MKILPVIFACTFTTLGLAIGTFATSRWIDEPHTQNTSTAMPSPREEHDSPPLLRSNNSQAKNPFELITGSQSELSAGVDLPVGYTDVTSTDTSYMQVSQLYDYHTMHSLLSAVSVADEHWLRSMAHRLIAVSSSFNSAAVFSLSAVIQRWAELAPDEVLQWITTMHSQGQLQYPHVQEAFLGIATTDARLIEHWLAQVDDEELEYVMKTSLYLSLASDNPAVTLDRLIGEPGAEQYTYELVAQWANSDPLAAYNWLSSSASTDMQLMLTDTIMDTWMQNDPQAAIEAIESMPALESKPYLIGRYAGMLAQSDPEGAFDYALNLSDQQARSFALAEAISTWSYTDGASLQLRLASLGDDALLDEVLQMSGPQIVSAMAEQSPEAAIQWVASLPEAARHSTLPVAFDQWFYQQPDEAIDWLRQQPSSNSTAKMQQTALWKLPELNLDYTLEVFDTLQRNEQESIAENIVYQLQKQRPEILETWLDDIAHPDVEALARKATANAPIAENPESSLQEISYLEGDQKIDRLVEVVRVLSVMAPDSVEQWLVANPLSATEQAQLERKVSDDMSQQGGCGPANYSLYGLFNPEHY